MSSSIATWGPSGRLVEGGASKSIARHLQDTIAGLANHLQSAVARQYTAERRAEELAVINQQHATG